MEDGNHEKPEGDASNEMPPPMFLNRLSKIGWSGPALRLSLVLSLIVAVCSTTLVWAFTKDSAVRNTNVGSRYGQVAALVDHGTYAITKTRYNRTIDKVMYEGEYYSSKPPLLPTVTAAVYWLYKLATGYDIRNHEKKVVRFCNLTLGAFLHFILMIYWLRFLLLLTRRPEVVVLAMAAMGFGFLGVGYAIELQNHTPAATLTLIGFYYAFRARNEIDADWRNWIYSGLSLGLLPGVDLPSLATTACVGVYLLTKDPARTLRLWLPALLPGLLLTATLNILSTGSIKPVYLRRELYKYPGSYWANPQGVDALREPKHIYAFHVLLGHHGMFSMTPLLCVSMVGLYQSLRRRTERFPEALCVLIATGILFTFYIRGTNNYGGNCVGFRWAIAFTPLLFVFFVEWMARTQLRWWHVTGVLTSITITMYHNWQSFWTPWHESAWERAVKKMMDGVL